MFSALNLVERPGPKTWPCHCVVFWLRGLGSRPGRVTVLCSG